MLNAIGMSGKQMKKMLIWESATYIGGAIVLTVTMGNLLGWLICQAEIVNLSLHIGTSNRVFAVIDFSGDCYSTDILQKHLQEKHCRTTSS